MLKNFFDSPNALGRLMIVLLLAGGVVFAGAFDGFVVQTQASNCCGSGTDASLFPSSGSNSCPTGKEGCDYPNDCDGCPPKGTGGFCSGRGSNPPSGATCCGPAD